MSLKIICYNILTKHLETEKTNSIYFKPTSLSGYCSILCSSVLIALFSQCVSVSNVFILVALYTERQLSKVSRQSLFASDNQNFANGY